MFNPNHLIESHEIGLNHYGYTTSDGIMPSRVLPEQNRVMEDRLRINHLPTPMMKAHALQARAQIANHLNSLGR